MEATCSQKGHPKDQGNQDFGTQIVKEKLSHPIAVRAVSHCPMKTYQPQMWATYIILKFLVVALLKRIR